MRARRTITLVLGACAGCGSTSERPASMDASSTGTMTTDGEGTTSNTVGPSSTADSTGASGSAEGSTSGTTAATGTTGGSSGVEGAWCGPIPTCDAPLPNAGPTIDWEHTESYAVASSGTVNHRGRDMFYRPGDAQWVLAKMAYGPTDWDLEDERVDLFLLRGCEGSWEALGSVYTTYEGDHATIEGVVDTGGRIYFQIPPEQTLERGRHRVHMVVRGDDTRADAFIEIVPEGTPIFVSDVDGTLTTSETEEFGDLLTGTTPDVQPFAPEALAILADKGYHPMYLTARPEFLGARTQQFVEERGLPPGIVHTTLNATGALGGAAVAYKTGELADLAFRGLEPAWAFGNSDSDAEAYDNADVQPLDHRVFVQFDDPWGGRRIESYADLLDELEALPDLCPD